MTPADFAAARKSLGFTQAGLAEHIGRSRAVIGKWERGLLPVDKLAGLYLALLLQVRLDETSTHKEA